MVIKWVMLNSSTSVFLTEGYVNELVGKYA